MTTFVAIDFETATTRRDSACAVGLAAGCNGRVVLVRTYLIRPPTAQFTFTDLHGLDWEDVRDAPTFGDLWPTLRAWIDDAEFLVAHNAAFDRSVLLACCARYQLRAPRIPFLCTVQLARAQWGIRPTKLPDVCRQLRILLRHHDAGSDAEACARIVLAALRARDQQLGLTVDVENGLFAGGGEILREARVRRHHGPERSDSRGEDLLALLAQLALEPDAPVERHGY